MAGIIVADPRRSPTVRQGADLHPTRPRRPGEVFVLFHYGRGAQSANQHTWYARDPISPATEVVARLGTAAKPR